jgi:hypothetical protein
MYIISRLLCYVWVRGGLNYTKLKRITRLLNLVNIVNICVFYTSYLFMIIILNQIYYICDTGDYKFLCKRAPEFLLTPGPPTVVILELLLTISNSSLLLMKLI